MTLPEPLSAAELLEGEYGLTAASLGLDAEAWNRRVQLWERVAAQRQQASPAQRAAHVAYLAFSGQIAYLIGQEDKFRAEGDITVEVDIMERVKYLQGLLPALQQEAGLVDTGTGLGSANPAPVLEPWGLG